ncbi:MAG: gamma carbonic anhydrase family protein [Bacillota bacterium]|jgi:carbonic anhydrase/acetyltransferase-like protein (isoleucine patch superfamily)
MTNPKINPDTFVANNATIIGDVEIGAGCSVWYGAVLRGDMAAIRIGEHSNVQDGCLLHVSKGFPLQLGDHVTVGHGAILHGCTIEDGVLIGMGAIVLDGAVVGQGSIIGAGALVPEGKVIPANSLVVGIPGKVIRQLTPEDAAGLIKHAAEYERLWRENYR